MTDIPDPLVPAEVDLRDMDGFMLNVERLLASELWALSTGDEFKAATSLWCRAWKQTPAASLPDDDRVLASFAGVGAARWTKIKKVAMRGFVLCSDGRFYHQVLAEDAMRAWNKKQSYRERGEKGNEKRWAKGRSRDEPGGGKAPPPGAQDRSQDHLEDDRSAIAQGSQKDRSATRIAMAQGILEPRQGQGQLQEQGQGKLRPRSASEARAREPDEPVTPPPRATRLPADFDVDLSEAAKRGLTPTEAAIESEKFRNHYAGAPGRHGLRIDWPATWRNWCIRACEMGISDGQRPRNSTPNPNGNGRSHATNDAILAAVIREFAPSPGEGQRQAGADGCDGHSASGTAGHPGKHIDLESAAYRGTRRPETDRH